MRRLAHRKERRAIRAISELRKSLRAGERPAGRRQAQSGWTRAARRPRAV